MLRLAEQLQAFVVHQVDDTFEGPENVDWPRLREDVMWHLQQTAVVAEGHLLAMDKDYIDKFVWPSFLQQYGQPALTSLEKFCCLDATAVPESTRGFVWILDRAATDMESDDDDDDDDKTSSEVGKPLRVLDAGQELVQLVTWQRLRVEEASAALREERPAAGPLQHVAASRPGDAS
ncbi:unnamed protein product [Symbiodinium sp. KB8]|nr:unnamed protein product [Symbiodinium sp. KB8]